MEMHTLWTFFYSESQRDKHIEEIPKSKVEYEDRI